MIPVEAICKSNRKEKRAYQHQGDLVQATKMRFVKYVKERSEKSP